ncbi:MAG: DUF4398 domain-containing protein [Xanthomonadaceae bacterium]|nr:DUF4398 domain-containing protein [Xanthomonadaceae bacterium]
MKAHAIFIALLALGACASVFETRPDQELADAIASVRAAKEVSAENMAPDLYRKAQQSLDLGKREYRFKNYSEAKAALIRAKSYGEKAEFNAIKVGGVRHETPKDPMAQPTAASTPDLQPVDAPPPEQVPVDDQQASTSPNQ